MEKTTGATATKTGLGIDDILTPVRAKILDLAAKHGITNVRVFGSVARGEARPDSDVDFLVDVDAAKSLLDLCGFSVDVEELLHRRADVVPSNSVRKEIRRRIFREARTL